MLCRRLTQGYALAVERSPRCAFAPAALLPVGFTIAGADQTFVPAQAAVEKDGRISVWSDAVAEPVAVRYAWADNPICTMYAGAGLPLTPFRTDDFPGITVNNN